jgi:hypothetical protein
MDLVMRRTPGRQLPAPDCSAFTPANGIKAFDETRLPAKVRIVVDGDVHYAAVTRHGFTQ